VPDRLKNKELELAVEYNMEACWAMIDNNTRFIKVEGSAPPQKPFDSPTSLYPSEASVNMDDCFAQFMSSEKLNNSNSWYCSKCQTHKPAIKKIQIFKLPPVLYISFKRFKGLRQKQTTRVDFPLKDFDMSKYVLSQRQKSQESLVYDLIAVSNHQGTLQAGHYTAFAKNKGQWYHFNDEVVKPVGHQDQVVSSLAYNLFYVRKDIDFERLDYGRMRQSVPPSEDAE